MSCHGYGIIHRFDGVKVDPFIPYQVSLPFKTYRATERRSDYFIRIHFNYRESAFPRFQFRRRACFRASLVSLAWRVSFPRLMVASVGPFRRHYTAVFQQTTNLSRFPRLLPSSQPPFLTTACPAVFRRGPFIAILYADSQSLASVFLPVFYPDIPPTYLRPSSRPSKKLFSDSTTRRAYGQPCEFVSLPFLSSLVYLFPLDSFRRFSHQSSCSRKFPYNRCRSLCSPPFILFPRIACVFAWISRARNFSHCALDQKGISQKVPRIFPRAFRSNEFRANALIMHGEFSESRFRISIIARGDLFALAFFKSFVGC